jgi:hypothetical protein
MLAWPVVRLPRLLDPWHFRVLLLFARHWHLVLAPATVAVDDSDTSSDPLVYDDYQTPTTHLVVATVDYATRDSLHGDMWEGELDISVPTRDWNSCAGSAQDEQVLAAGDNRNCYLCFSPDNFTVN